MAMSFGQNDELVRPARPPAPQARTTPVAQTLGGPAERPSAMEAPRAPQTAAAAGAAPMAAQAAAATAGGWGAGDEVVTAAPKQVGFMESAGRTAGAAAVPVVQTLGLASAGLVKAASVLPLGRIFGFSDQEVSALQDAIFKATENTTQSMRDMYAPKAGEEFSTAGQIAGGVASMPIELAGGLGIQHGVQRATDVIDRGGSLGEAATAGTVVAGANAAVNALPGGLGRAGGALIKDTAQAVLPNVLNRLGAGQAIAAGTSALIGGTSGAAGDLFATAAGNTALPEGEQFSDLRQEADPAASFGLGAAFGGLGHAAAVRSQAAHEASYRSPLDAADPNSTEIGQRMNERMAAGGSVGATGVSDARMRDQRARDMPIPMQLTEGMLTGDLAQQRFEREQAKLVTGGKLRDNIAEINDRISRNLQAMEDGTGATMSDRAEQGRTVVSTLEAIDADLKGRTDAAYKEWRGWAQQQPDADVQGLIDVFNSDRHLAGTVDALKDVQAKLTQSGAATMVDGQLVPTGKGLPLLQIEAMRGDMLGNGRDAKPTEQRVAARFAEAADGIITDAGGEQIHAARAAHEARMRLMKEHGAVADLLAIKRGKSDRTVPFDKVVNRIILGSDPQGLRDVRDVLLSGGEQGQAAWREIQAATFRHISESIFGNAGRNERRQANASPTAFAKAVKELDRDNRLADILGTKGRDQIHDLLQITRDVHTATDGALNTSGTGAYVREMLTQMAGDMVNPGGWMNMAGRLVGGAKQAAAVRKNARQQVAATRGGQPEIPRGAIDENARPYAPRQDQIDAAVAAAQPRVRERAQRPIPAGDATELNVDMVDPAPAPDAAPARAADRPAGDRPVIAMGDVSDAEWGDWLKAHSLGEADGQRANVMQQALDIDLRATLRAIDQFDNQPAKLDAALRRILSGGNDAGNRTGTDAGGTGLEAPKGSDGTARRRSRDRARKDDGSAS